MSTNAERIESWYDAALKQIAAESYFHDINLADAVAVEQRLLEGNTPPNSSPPQYVRMVPVQASEFIGRYQIIDQLPNTSSGFSATFLFDSDMQKYSLVFRSTEWKNFDKGGDYQRDGALGAGAEIASAGFALGQLRDMEWYLEQLRLGILQRGSVEDGTAVREYFHSGGKLEIVGYSLGAHLATVFTELHASEGFIERATLFNAAGRGDIQANRQASAGASIAEVLRIFNALLENPHHLGINELGALTDEEWTYKDRAFTAPAPPRDGGPDDARNSIYTNARYQWARLAVQKYFSLSGLLLSPGTTLGLDPDAAVLIEQLYGHATHDDFELVANSGIHADTIPIFIEDQPEIEGLPKIPIFPELTASFDGDFGNTHSLTLIVDSLALMNAFMTIDPNLTKRDIEAIFAASSYERARLYVPKVGTAHAAESDSLEKALDSLRRLFTPDNSVSTPVDDSAGGFGNTTVREEFYANLNALLAASVANNHYRIFSLVPITQFYGEAGGTLNGEPKPEIVLPQADELLNGAYEAGEVGTAYRYALRDLNPFVVIDTQNRGLYSRFEEDGELNFYDGSLNRTSLTQKYLEDRAALLERKLYVTTLNLDKNYINPNATQSSKSLPQTLDVRGQGYQEEAKSFGDRSSGFIVASGSPNRNSEQHFIFGSSQSEVLAGAGREDHLYGSAGTDYLEGRGDDDYLEGGPGLDVYAYRAGDGNDTILDADGQGVLRYTYTDTDGNELGTVIAEASIKLNNTTWESADGRFSYTKTPNEHGGDDLLVTINVNGGGTLTLKDFRDGDFGIRLWESRADPVTVRTLEGDFQPSDADPSQTGVQLAYDSWGNVLTTSDPAVDRDDGLFGRDDDQGDLILGGGGNDIIFGDTPMMAQPGPRAGFDPSDAGGADWIQAGAGRDFVIAGPGDDLVEGGFDGVAAGEAGGDVISGGPGNDTLYGDYRIEIGAAIRAGETDSPTGLKGDFISGGAGDDWVVGGRANDALLGGGGSDVIVGGAGDDTIFGDGGESASTLGWTVTRTITVQNGQTSYQVSLDGVVLTDTSAGGADTIYAGAGADWVFAGAGDDFVDAGSGNDVVFGDGGSDILLGGPGDDVLSGDNPGFVTGSDEGGDYLDGGDGDDKLYGNGGDDILVGGRGNDLLVGGAGRDIYLFSKGDGVDIIEDDDTDEEVRSVLLFGPGLERDDIRFGVGSLKISFASTEGQEIHFQGFDQVNPHNTPLIGEIHFDDGQMMTYADILAQGFDIDGTPAADVLTGTGVGDRIRGFAGNDVLHGLDGDDFLYGGDGADTLHGGAGDDYLDGGAGADTLLGGAGDDTYVYDTLDVVIDTEGMNRIVFGPGIAPEDLRMSALVVSGQPRLLIAHPGEAGPGLDIRGATLTTPNFVYAFADGRTLSQAQLVQASYYGAQNLNGGSGNDTLIGFAGNDSLFGGDGDDTLIGNGGNDTLTGSNGDDALYGGAGDDKLFGGPGNDLLSGGPGNDFLNGGQGADTYLFGYGDGQDTVADDGTDSAIDVVRLADGISAADVSITREASGDLVVRLNGTQDKLVLRDWYTSPASRVERIEFGDGTALEEAQLAALLVLPIAGSSGNDVLTGTRYADTLEGLAGDDTLDGGLGDDILIGGEGSDRYVLGWSTGKDTVVELAGETSIVLLPYSMQLDDLAGTRIGNDLFLHIRATEDGLLLKDYYDQAHDWQLQSADGQVQALEDFLAQPQPTTGDPVLDLWEARKTTIKNLFYSRPDTVILSDGRLYHPHTDVRGASFNRFYYNGETTSGSGSLPNVHTIDNYYALQFDTVTSDATSQYWFLDAWTSETAQTAATYTIAWDDPQLTSTTSYAGTYVGADLIIRPLYLTQASGSLTGDAEAIALSVSQGASALELFAAAVSGAPLPAVVNGTFFTIDQVEHVSELHAGASNNTIGFRGFGLVDGGAGDDLIDSSGGGYWIGNLLYGNAGNDRITGSGEDDLIIGGPGDDRLAGWAGNDTYYFFANDAGVDVVNEVTWFLWDTADGWYIYNADSGRGSTDTVEFGPGISLEGLALSWGSIRSPHNHPSVLRTYETLDIFWDAGKGVRVMMPDRTDSQVLQDMQWYPGASWGIEYFKFADGSLLTMDEMANRVPVSVLNGTSGDDYLLGTWGRDVLTGGPGSDYLEGDAGDDLYRFNVGDGEDWIDDRQGTDTILFGPGITPEMITLGLGSLRIQIGSTGDVLHIERFDPDDALGSGAIEIYQFDNGVTLTHAQLLERGFDIYGTANGETLSGTSVQDRIFGFAGDDTLIGGAGDDTLDGGAGNDVLIGGEGSDVYAFAVGSGQDAIEETDAEGDDTDALALGAGITPANLRFSRVGQSLVLGIEGAPDALAVRRWYDGTSYQIEEIRFQGGPTWDAATIAALVPAPNQAPVLADPIPDQTADEDAPFEFTVPAQSFLDPDVGETLTYAAQLANGSALPSWLTFNASTRTFSGTPTNSDVGTLSVRVTATDPSAVSVSDIFDLTVLNTNDAPTLASPIADQNAKQGQAFAFTVPANAFIDVDVGDTLTYSASLADGSALPGWLGFNATTRTFSGTPSSTDVGAIDVRVTATDGSSASASDVFSLTVAGNMPPRLFLFPIPDRSATEDAAFSFAVSFYFYDPDGDPLTYSASLADGSPLPAWLSFDAASKTFTGTPANDDVGTASIRVTVTDTSNASASDVFDITVLNTNDAPVVANAIVDQEAMAGQAFTFTMPANTFLDVDAGDTLAYSAQLADGSPLPGWLEFDPSTRTFSGTPSSGDAGSIDVRVTAIDGSAASVSDVFKLTVTGANSPPTVASPIADQSATEDVTFSFTLPMNTFADPDAGDTLTYAASLADGSALPSWIFFDAATLTFSGTPANDDVGTIELTVWAMDAAGATASDSFALSVANVNDAPIVAVELADQSVEAGSHFLFTVPGDTFIDIDVGDTLTLSAATAGGGALPAWLSFDPATATLSGSPQLSDLGVSGIVVTAADASGASASSDFALVVAAPWGSSVRGGSGDNILYGSGGDETLSGGQGNDVLFGGLGNDLLRGGGGNDVLQGGDGDDVLRSGPGDNVLDGGSGNDLIFDGAGNSFIAGGTGNDTIRLSAGNDVISFNRGDGWDTIFGGGDGGNTLSFGGGIRYSDLSLSKNGTDLIVNAGGDNGIVLKDWYGGTRSVLNLQLILDAMEDFDAASSDPLRNRRVQTFDFLGMVSAFDQARAASPGLTSWQVTNALLQFHLSGADDMALGGDLAYWYARNGSLAGMSVTAAQQVIGAAGFGSDAQALRPFSGLEEGFVKLS